MERLTDQRGSLTTAGNAHHAVQFYDDDAFLVDAVSRYIDAGLELGQPAVIVATEAHRDGIAASLVARGHDLDALTRAGTLTLRDARETMAIFMRDGRVDADRLRGAMRAILDEARGERATVRAFGEMVDLLWRDGNGRAVLEVEGLWNELTAAGGIELLCAYDMAQFASAASIGDFAAICGAHRHVLPTESYTRACESSRLVEITSLQQRARALETELRHRALLEQRLRDALEQRERLLDEERAARAEAERARVVAQEANRAKSTFLALMSHELRTPLNAIGGYAELIRMEVFGSVSEGQAAALERLQASQRHLLALIDQVLGYVDAESGAARYDIDDAPVGEILASVEGAMLPLLKARGLTYVRGADPGALVVRADAAKVRQILLQLMSNAVKFTEPGGHVQVDTRATATGVLVHVRDTGVGMAGEDLAKVFEPFLQADSGLTRTHGGIGLGLTLSRDLARAMRGDLTAESVAGIGSTFTLVLPRGEVAAR